MSADYQDPLTTMNDRQPSPGVDAVVQLVTTFLQQLTRASDVFIIIFGHHDPAIETGNLRLKMMGGEIPPSFSQQQVRWLNENEIFQINGAKDSPCLSVPLRIRQNLYGAIILVAPVTGTDDWDMLGDIGNNAAAVLEISLLHEEMKAKIRYLSDYDDLVTKLPNRKVLLNDLRHAIDSLPPGHYCYLFFIDLDDLKHVNRKLGYSTGDQLLFTIAQRLMGFAKDKGIEFVPARIGGDEFGLILTGNRDKKLPEFIASAMLEAIREPLLVAGIPYEITASIGLAVYPENAGSANELLFCSEQAMFAAKDKGKNTYLFFHD